MRWINVSDELPTLRIRKNMNAYIYESDRHLVYNGGPHVAILQKHVYKKVMFWIDAYTHHILSGVTHWAPIAPIPDEEDRIP